MAEKKNVYAIFDSVVMAKNANGSIHQRYRGCDGWYHINCFVIEWLSPTGEVDWAEIAETYPASLCDGSCKEANGSPKARMGTFFYP